MENCLFALAMLLTGLFVGWLVDPVTKNKSSTHRKLQNVMFMCILGFLSYLKAIIADLVPLAELIATVTMIGFLTYYALVFAFGITLWQEECE